VVPTVAFRLLFVFIVLAHDRRRVIHFNVSAYPTSEWTAHQIAEAFPWESAPRYLQHDRDSMYGGAFRKRFQEMNIQEVQTAPRSPWQNPYAERLIGSIRREFRSSDRVQRSLFAADPIRAAEPHVPPGRRLADCTTATNDAPPDKALVFPRLQPRTWARQEPPRSHCDAIVRLRSSPITGMIRGLLSVIPEERQHALGSGLVSRG
jgi:hypothetical protein